MNRLLPYAIAVICGGAVVATLGACAHGPDYVKPTSTTAKASEAAPARPASGAQQAQPSNTPAPAAGRSPV